MHQATLKVAGGKLLRINMQLENVNGDLIIQTIQLTGDFFLHPEDVLPDIEQALAGMGWPDEEDKYIDAVQKVLDEKQAEFIGVAPLDVAHAILAASA